MESEIKLQSACTIWFQNEMFRHRGYFRRVKNELDQWGTNRVAQLVNNRSTGIVPGTWDAFLCTQPITWIEFKTAKGRLSDAQKEFQKIGEKLGWNFRVVRTLEEFQDVCYFFLCGT
jgi:hypothetical protein